MSYLWAAGVHVVGDTVNLLTKKPGDEAPNIPCCGLDFWLYVLLCFALVSFAAVMAGLTMALMSLDPMNISIIMATGTASEKVYATAVEPILRDRHLLLVTLLICNASAMEALPIFLDKLVSTRMAIILSVTLVLIFSEIIPQAVFTRYRLPISAHLSTFVMILELLLWPLAWPIAKLLDKLLGSEHLTIFRKAELKELTEQHLMTPHGGTLTQDEVRIMGSTLEMAEKQAKDAMTPLAQAYMLQASRPLTTDVKAEIMATGFSRVPVYHGGRKDVVGVVRVKNLALVADGTQVSELFMPSLAQPNPYGPAGAGGQLPRVPADSPLFDILHFLCHQSRMALVCHGDKEALEEGEVVGVITLEDVIEELIQEEIMDETDQGLDAIAMLALNHAKQRADRAGRWDRQGGSIWGEVFARSKSRSRSRGQSRGSGGVPPDSASRQSNGRDTSSPLGEAAARNYRPVALAALMKTRGQSPERGEGIVAEGMLALGPEGSFRANQLVAPPARPTTSPPPAARGREDDRARDPNADT